MRTRFVVLVALLCVIGSVTRAAADTIQVPKELPPVMTAEQYKMMMTPGP